MSKTEFKCKCPMAQKEIDKGKLKQGIFTKVVKDLGSEVKKRDNIVEDLKNENWN